MSDKITVRICAGTTCFVMGASDMLLLEETLPESLKGRVEIAGANCLGLCKDGRNGSSPFVTVNGEILENATLPSVLQKIREVADAEHQ